MRVFSLSGGHAIILPQWLQNGALMEQYVSKDFNAARNVKRRNGRARSWWCTTFPPDSRALLDSSWLNIAFTFHGNCISPLAPLQSLSSPILQLALGQYHISLSNMLEKLVIWINQSLSSSEPPPGWLLGLPQSLSLCHNPTRSNNLYLRGGQ